MNFKNYIILNLLFLSLMSLIGLIIIKEAWEAYIFGCLVMYLNWFSWNVFIKNKKSEEQKKEMFNNIQNRKKQ